MEIIKKKPSWLVVNPIYPPWEMVEFLNGDVKTITVILLLHIVVNPIHPPSDITHGRIHFSNRKQKH